MLTKWLCKTIYTVQQQEQTHSNKISVRFITPFEPYQTKSLCVDASDAPYLVPTKKNPTLQATTSRLIVIYWVSQNEGMFGSDGSANEDRPERPVV